MAFPNIPLGPPSYSSSSSRVYLGGAQQTPSYRSSPRPAPSYHHGHPSRPNRSPLSPPSIPRPPPFLAPTAPAGPLPMSPLLPLPTPPNSSPPRDKSPDVLDPRRDDSPVAIARTPMVLRAMRPEPITLEDLTPTFLLFRVNLMEAPLVLHNVTPDDFTSWRSRFPGLIEDDNARYEYNSLAERMIVKCMPWPIHDSLQLFMCQRIMKEVSSSKADGKLRFGSGTTFTGFNGDYAFASQKLPDAYVRVSKHTEFPTVVAEAGWSEDLPQLIEDAKLWVEGSGFRTRVVLLTAFTEIREDGHSVVDGDGETEAELIACVDRGGMSEMALAPRLLALHRRNGLAEPLLGTIHATMHVYRLDAENNLYEDFTTVVLPAPPMAEADEADEADDRSNVEMPDALEPSLPEPDCDSDSDSSCSSVSTTEEPDFYLTLQDLFGTFPPPRKIDLAFRIGFSMHEFRKIIAEQVPAMEQCRSVMRAVKILKKKGLYVERETFAMMKARKRMEMAE